MTNPNSLTGKRFASPLAAMSSIAVYNAVRCMPEDVCNLISEYLIEKPHEFTPIDRSVEIRKQSKEIRMIGISTCSWRTLVSTTTFANGHLEWTVDFSWMSNAVAFVGAGVTTRSANRYDVNDRYADFNIPVGGDRILYPDPYVGLKCQSAEQPDQITKYCHSYRSMNRYFLAGQHPPVQLRFRLIFVADASTGTVSVRFVESVGTDDWFESGGLNTLIIASPDDFKLLRPCVVLGGAQTPTVEAVFRSGSEPLLIDDPTVKQIGIV